MNRIKEQINKFNRIKSKFQSQDIKELTKTSNNTILAILNNHNTKNIK